MEKLGETRLKIIRSCYEDEIGIDMDRIERCMSSCIICSCHVP